VGEALYDRIGAGYGAARGEDPRLAAAIHAALGDARSVVNVGAGTGSYEPRDRDVLAVEPSAVMRAQRPPGAAHAVGCVAEALPLGDGAVDAAMAVLTLHHWSDWRAGVAEMRRVAHRQVVVCTWDPGRLAADLESGRWAARHADLLERDELDLGYRLLAGPGGARI
jgi:SAM-dependent methyltransferase